jgi:tRNA-dihydrouridine synthase
MRIMLAPMEGVVEHHVRDILSRIGGLDGCVTEFIRVTDQKLPYKVCIGMIRNVLMCSRRRSSHHCQARSDIGVYG